MRQVIIPPLAPTIDWAELRLRGLRREDAPSWFAYLADPIVIEHTSFPVQSLASVEALIEQSQRGYSERSSCKWALARTSDDALIGTCGFNACRRPESSAITRQNPELLREKAPPPSALATLRLADRTPLPPGLSLTTISPAFAVAT